MELLLVELIVVEISQFTTDLLPVVELLLVEFVLIDIFIVYYQFTTSSRIREGPIVWGNSSLSLQITKPFPIDYQAFPYRLPSLSL